MRTPMPPDTVTDTSTDTSHATPPPGRLDRPQDAWTRPRPSTSSVSTAVHGFGGLQGGIALALAVDALADHGLEVDTLRSLHARYDRAIRDEVTTIVRDVDERTNVDHATVDLHSGGRRAVTVTATLGRPTATTAPTGPTMARLRSPERYDRFALPPEFVPFGQFIEIRPTTAARPFGGAPEPRLTAWVRLQHDDAPVDLRRLLVLVDALAPSAAATMTAPVPIPTLELTVRPTPTLRRTSSPWVLLDAVSSVTADGWVDETILVWAPDGTHLATATQLRLVRAGR